MSNHSLHGVYIEWEAAPVRLAAGRSMVAALPGSQLGSRCEAEQDTRNCALKLGHFKTEALFTSYKIHCLNI